MMNKGASISSRPTFQLSRFLPCLNWFQDYSSPKLKADLVSGVTVALVLIPQSMAYAQLAGLPPYYGLYASLLPPVIGSVFGSSSQLATGPVAVVSLMTSAALAPLATAGSEAFVAYAILLSLLVGAFQFSLGLLRLGLLVNFLSHPVVNGFTNAAALVIATSQLSKLFGVSVDTAGHHYQTVFNVLRAASHHIHWPTFGIALLAFAIMIVLRWISPKIPYVLVAVVVTIVVSRALDYENNRTIQLSQIKADRFQSLVRQYNSTLVSL
ncbi:MAG: SulP family inorganic anion transporter, partial [bacterium]